MPANTWRPFTIEDALSIRPFSDRAPLRFSPDGQLLAYCLEDHSSDEPCDQVWVTDVETGRAQQVLPGVRTAWGVSWSPVATMLAFIADSGEGQQPWVWDAETGEARRISTEVIAAEFRFEVPRWTPDGRALVCKSANAEWLSFYHPSGVPIVGDPEPTVELGNPSVRCFKSGGRTEPTVVGQTATAGGMSGRLTRFDLQTSEAHLLTDTHTRDWAVSPDGEWVAFSRFLGGNPATAGALFDLCVIPISGGEVRTLARSLAVWWFGPAFSWSPDSTMLAFRGDGVIRVVAVDSAEPRVLSNATTGGFSSGIFDPPRWSPDSSFVLVGQRTLWKLPVIGGEPTDLIPERGAIFVQPTLLALGDETTYWSPDGGSVIVGAHSDADGRLLLRVCLDGSGRFERSFPLNDLTSAPRFSMDVSRQGLISFVREDATHPADVWVTAARFSEPRRLTEINPHVRATMFSMPRLLDWQGPDGKQHQSAFFPPGTPGATPPHPVVLWVYEGERAADLAYFGGDEVRSNNVHLLTSRGYGVCIPDIPVADEHPAQSIREALACAVRGLVDSGLADQGCIGIIGHSYGGYIVNIAVAGLGCFAAAVCDTGTVNLTSAYNAGRDEGNFWQWCENGQGRMGVPPWVNPQRYVENSPLFTLESVTTPLLIIHGSKDPEIGQAWELFNGLRRLNRPVTLAVYEGESHCIERRTNVIDRWTRVLEWFGRYLTHDKEA